MGLENSTVTVEVLATQVADLRAANDRLVREVEALRSARPAQGSARAAATPAKGARGPGRAGTDRPGSSRRGVLRTAAKVAAAAVAAGVLVERVTGPASADTLGAFTSSNGSTPAVTGTGTNGSPGVSGVTDYGIGVQGTGKFAVSGTSAASQGYGVQGINTSNVSTSIAVFGQSQDGSGFDGPGIGVQGETGGGIGVVGLTTGFGTGIQGSSPDPSGYGVHGINSDGSSGSVAILGESLGFADGIGVEGSSVNGDAVVGDSHAGRGGVFTSDMFRGIDAYGGAIGIRTNSTSGDGLDGSSGGASGLAVWGVNYSNTVASVAIKGSSQNGSGGLGPGTGLVGETASGTGVYGTATTGNGVYGTTAGGAAKQAVWGVGTSGSTGLRASSDSGNGVVASSTSGTGLNVQSSSGSAVIATSNGVGYGLYLTAPSGWAIGCVGRIRVIGNAVGTATLAHATTSKTVSSSACSASSQVILTPTSDPQVRVWATAAPGSFTIHANAAPSSDVTFAYFLIN